ncbi:MAG: hypothetical protein KDA58_02880 [Planctomycetaceae bacterium]|nr:hypothetical protein [Planctomycetaceae bacterium]
MRSLTKMLVAALVCLTPGLLFAQIGDSPETKKPEPDQRVRVLLDDLGLKYEIDDDGDFKMVFEVGDSGRSQLVWIRSATETYRELEIREIISPGYKAESGDFPGVIALRLLEDNRQKKLGGWQKDGNMGIFVTHVGATVKADTLHSAIIFAVEAADEMEQKISGDKDEF